MAEDGSGLIRWVVSPNLIEVRMGAQPRGFSFCKYHHMLNEKLKSLAGPPRRTYHYRIGSVEVQEAPNFRYQYFTGVIGEGCLHYRRKIGPVKMQMSYDLDQRVMTSNAILSQVPFEIGRLWPPGLHLTNIITNDLLIKDGILSLHGATVEVNGKTVCIFSPSRTGKSTTIRNMLKQGVQYISEDIILTDGSKSFMVPPNDRVTIEALLKGRGFKLQSEIDEVILCYPHPVPEGRRQDLAYSQLLMCSNRMLFTNDNMVHSLHFYNNEAYMNQMECQREIIQKLLGLRKLTFVPSMQALEEYVVGL